MLLNMYCLLLTLLLILFVGISSHWLVFVRFISPTVNKLCYCYVLIRIVRHSMFMLTYRLCVPFNISLYELIFNWNNFIIITDVNILL